MAGACGCERCCHLPGKGLREGLEGSGAGKRQARTPFKTHGWGMWLREVLPVAWERLAGGFGGFGGGQTAGSNALKNNTGWPAKSKNHPSRSEFQRWTAYPLENWKLNQKMKPTRRQALMRSSPNFLSCRPGKHWHPQWLFEQTLEHNSIGRRHLTKSMAARGVASCLGKACGRVWRVWGRANGRLERL